MKIVKVTRRSGNLIIKTEYSKTDKFCPHCGNQDIWMELGEGDYYIGSEYLCVDCNSSHYLDITCNQVTDEEQSIIDQILEK